MEWVVLESSQHPALAYGLLPAALPSTPATPLLQTPAQQPLPASARFELTCAGTLGSSAASRLLPCPVFYRGLVLPSLTHADPTVTRPKCVHRHSFPIHSLIPHLHSFFPFEQKTSFHPHIVILSTQSKQSTPAAAISDSDDDSDSDSNTIRPKDSRHSSRPPGVPPQQSTEKRSCVRPPPSDAQPRSNHSVTGLLIPVDTFTTIAVLCSLVSDRALPVVRFFICYYILPTQYSCCLHKSCGRPPDETSLSCLVLPLLRLRDGLFPSEFHPRISVGDKQGCSSLAIHRPSLSIRRHTEGRLRYPPGTDQCHLCCKAKREQRGKHHN